MEEKRVKSTCVKIVVSHINIAKVFLSIERLAQGMNIEILIMKKKK
jgi:hypothetical protein